jgi:hypothetical protein
MTIEVDVVDGGLVFRVDDFANGVVDAVIATICSNPEFFRAAHKRDRRELELVFGDLRRWVIAELEELEDALSPQPQPPQPPQPPRRGSPPQLVVVSSVDADDQVPL